MGVPIDPPKKPQDSPLVRVVPALTARDANSDALLDLFDFCSTPVAVGTLPAAGTGGCPM